MTSFGSHLFVKGLKKQTDPNVRFKVTSKADQRFLPNIQGQFRIIHFLNLVNENLYTVFETFDKDTGTIHSTIIHIKNSLWR